MTNTRNRTALVVTASVMSFAIIHIVFIGNSWDRLISFFWDDTFYYTTISRNIALGIGPSTDSLNWTNGFQPLWALFVVPIYWLDPEEL